VIYESPSVDMFPFGVTVAATVPQRSEIPEGLMNYPVCKYEHIPFQITHYLIDDVLHYTRKCSFKLLQKVEFQYFSKNKYINCQTAVVRVTEAYIIIK
jgi:hypothetical protein